MGISISLPQLSPQDLPGLRIKSLQYLSQSICLQVCYFHPGGPMIFGCKLAAPRLKRLGLDEKRNAEKRIVKATGSGRSRD